MMIGTNALARTVKELQRLKLLSTDYKMSDVFVDEMFFVHSKSSFWSPLS